MSQEFEHPFDIPSDAAGREQLLATLRTWKGRAEPDRLAVICLDAAYAGDWSPRDYTHDRPPPVCVPALCHHFQWPLQRAHGVNPALIHTGARLNITRGIAVGPSKNAQIYLASVVPGSSVVVKVYQSSLLELAAYHRPHVDGYQSEWVAFLRQYALERWAYDRMRELQGTVVPHVYGFYKTTLPHGEPAVVMVMEHIQDDFEHIPLLQPGLSDNAEAIVDVGLGLVAATHAIVSCGVCHMDVDPRNVLWSLQQNYSATVGPTHHNGPLPIFIDFGCVTNIGSAADGGGFMKCAVYLFRGILFEENLSKRCIRALFAENDCALLKIFHLPPDKLVNWFPI